MLHYHEHDSLTRYRVAQDAEIEKLRSYCKFISSRLQSHALVVNEISPVIASSMFDDLCDGAMQLGSDPRDW